MKFEDHRQGPPGASAGRLRIASKPR
jgi:hypothetical protein